MKIRLPKFSLPKISLPKFGKREQDVLGKAVPVITDIALDAVKEQTGAKPPKRDAIWWIKLVVLLGLAVSPVFVDAFPDQTWDDTFAAAVGLAAAMMGIKHVRGPKPSPPAEPPAEPK